MKNYHGRWCDMDNYVNILGIEFSKLNLKETVNLIDRKISERSNRIFHLITVNPEIAVQIQEDPELKKISLADKWIYSYKNELNAKVVFWCRRES